MGGFALPLRSVLPTDAPLESPCRAPDLAAPLPLQTTACIQGAFFLLTLERSSYARSLAKRGTLKKAVARIPALPNLLLLLSGPGGIVPSSPLEVGMLDSTAQGPAKP